MADDVIGSSPQLLGVASDAAYRAQQQKNLREQQSQDVANNAMAPSQKAGEVSAVNAADKITITPQMADGISKMTGDDGWKRATGTKWDPRIFTAIVGMQSKKDYHEEILDNKDKIAQMNIDAKLHDLQLSSDLKEQATKQAKELQEEMDEKFAKWAKDHGVTKSGGNPNKSSGGKGGAKLSTEDSEFEKDWKSAQDFVRKTDPNIMSSDPGVGAQLKKANDFLSNSDNVKRHSKISGQKESDDTGSDDEAKKQQATKILTDAGKPVTDANLKHVMDQLK